jgi:hypothetical protein
MSPIRWLLGTLLIYLICFASLSSAAEIERKNGYILLEGEIVEGDLNRLRARLLKYGNLGVALNSPGGSLGEALKIGSFIRTSGLATHIPKSATCASACVTIFAGGLIRTAHPDSNIGIHMASAVFNDRFVQGMEAVISEYGTEATPYVVAMFEELAASAMLRQVYFILQAGVSLRLLEATTSVPHDEIFWMSIDDAISVNLINFY